MCGVRCFPVPWLIGWFSARYPRGTDNCLCPLLLPEKRSRRSMRSRMRGGCGRSSRRTWTPSGASMRRRQDRTTPTTLRAPPPTSLLASGSRIPHGLSPQTLVHVHGQHLNTQHQGHRLQQLLLRPASSPRLPMRPCVAGPPRTLALQQPDRRKSLCGLPSVP